MPKNGEKTTIALLNQKVDYISKAVDSIQTQLDAKYATQSWVDAEYGQTKKIVNAILITFGTVVVAAIATWIIRGGLQ
jgi:hypothetical protein